MFKILVVDDDINLNKSIRSFLIHNGYDVTGCLRVADAYDAMYKKVFDIIISDIMIPDVNGFEFAETIRNINKEIPILFISSLDDFPSKQKGFNAGIDDYMVKPIDFNELLLRIGALLRRAKIVNSRKLVIGSLTMNADEYTVSVGGEDIPLSVKEFNILYKLLSYPKRTFTRLQLMEEFWSADSSTGQRTVDVYITKLREKMSMCKDFEIVTVHGLGYKAIIK